MHDPAPPKPRCRSTPWLEAIAAGEDPPTGRVCRFCRCIQPKSYYFPICGGGVCWDCLVPRPAYASAGPRPHNHSQDAPTAPETESDALRAVLAGLSPAHREIYLAIHREGLSLRELAARRGTSAAAVFQNLLRIRKLLAAGGVLEIDRI